MPRQSPGLSWRPVAKSVDAHPFGVPIEFSKFERKITTLELIVDAVFVLCDAMLVLQWQPSVIFAASVDHR